MNEEICGTCKWHAPGVLAAVDEFKEAERGNKGFGSTGGGSDV